MAIKSFFQGTDQEKFILTHPFERYLGAEAERVQSYDLRGKKVLDMGCGPGRSGGIILGCPYPPDMIVGVDYLLEKMVVARENLDEIPSVHYVCGNALSLPFDNGSFDYVVMLWNFFANLGDDRDPILAEALRVINPSGKIILSVLSDSCEREYVDFIKANGMEVVSSDKNFRVLSAGLKSEKFNITKLENIAKTFGINAVIKPLADIAYWCELSYRL